MQEEQAAAAAAPGAMAPVTDNAPENAQADGAQPAQPVEVAEDDLVEQIESSIVTPNEPMDLPSTKEALDMFSEYYDDDCAKAKATIVNNTSIQTGLNFASPVLDPEYVPQQVRPMHATTLGSSSESFDISALL